MPTEKQLANLKPAQPGEVRNPKGKPKGTLSAKTLIKKWLASKETIINPITKKPSKMSQLDIMVLKQIEKARKGDTNAFNALMNRAEGMPKQQVENVDGNGETIELKPRQVIVIGGKEIEF